MNLIEITREEYQSGVVRQLNREQRRIPVRQDLVDYYTSLIRRTNYYSDKHIPVRYIYDVENRSAGFEVLH